MALRRKKKRRRGHRLEKDAVTSILEYGALRPRLLIWKQPVLRTKIEGRWAVGGVPGQPDITGVLKTKFGGIRIDIEVKSWRGTQRPLQKRYMHAVQQYNGIYIIARTAADVEAVIGPLEKKLWGV
jgi:hypothetical protein